MRYAGVSSFGVLAANQLLYDRRLLPDALNTPAPYWIAAEKLTRCYVGRSQRHSTLVWRAGDGLLPGRRERMRMPALWPSLPARALSRSPLLLLAAPLNCETAERAKSLGWWKSGALVYQATGATAASGSVAATAQVSCVLGALWVKRCTSTQRRLPTRWIAVFPPSEMLTPSLR